MLRSAWLSEMKVSEEVVVKTVLCCETQHDLGWKVKSISSEEIVITKEEKELVFCRDRGLRLYDSPVGEQGNVMSSIVSTFLLGHPCYIIAEDAMRQISELGDCVYSEEVIMVIFTKLCSVGEII
jgi:hypothetical protein